MEPLKTGLAGLAQLSNVLRNLPPSHKWDFGRTGGLLAPHCGSYGCAIGVAKAFWPAQVKDTFNFAEVFALPRADLHPIFGMWEEDWGLAAHYGKAMMDVTPVDVANAIDAYIAKHQPALPTLAIIITTPQKSVRATL